MVTDLNELPEKAALKPLDKLPEKEVPGSRVVMIDWRESKADEWTSEVFLLEETLAVAALFDRAYFTYDDLGKVADLSTVGGSRDSQVVWIAKKCPIEASTYMHCIHLGLRQL